MKQTARIISTYTGDTSGVCSALFELGGMTVMHDASGCNSTYSTHDEPRWYNSDSLVFISGLTETEAILGDDEKLIHDTIQTAQELHPKFIALAGSPIPMMTGVDLPAIACEIENTSHLPTFGFNTDGMHSYVSGAGQALAAIAKRYCRPSKIKASTLTVNLLGVTPLDFSINGSVPALTHQLNVQGVQVQSVWAMGSTLAQLAQATRAQVNLVVSASGFKTAQVLQQQFGMPYVVGTPYGATLTKAIVAAIKRAAKSQQNQLAVPPLPNAQTLIVGEGVTALSLAHALFADVGATVLCPTELPDDLLGKGCVHVRDEAELLPYFKQARIIIADPLYQPICPKTARFIPLAHEAFSGRLYRKEIPNLVSELDQFRRSNQL